MGGGHRRQHQKHQGSCQCVRRWVLSRMCLRLQRLPTFKTGKQQRCLVHVKVTLLSTRDRELHNYENKTYFNEPCLNYYKNNTILFRS